MTKGDEGQRIEQPSFGDGRIPDRFWSKAHEEGDSDCWIWRGATATNGYGRFSDGDRLKAAHRSSYEKLVGPIPDGLVLDHLCRVRNCVNPSHLEAMTNPENTRKGLKRQPMTHCPRGHEFTPENTKVSMGKRACRECRRINQRKGRSFIVGDPAAKVEAYDLLQIRANKIGFASVADALDRLEKFEADHLAGVIEEIEKARAQISGGLCYFTAEAKHAQLHDAEKTLSALAACLTAKDRQDG